MMINYFAMQIELGWITIEQVPLKYREKVRQLIELSNVGTTEGQSDVRFYNVYPVEIDLSTIDELVKQRTKKLNS